MATTKATPEATEPKRRLRVEYYRDEAGTHRWRLTSSNGRIIATSGEGYRRRSEAERAFGTVGAGALAAVVVEPKPEAAPAPPEAAAAPAGRKPPKSPGAAKGPAKAPKRGRPTPPA